MGAASSCRGGYILIAAHCIRAGIMFEELMLGGRHLHRIRTASGREILTEPVCVEPCSDIAVLAAVDGKFDEGEKFDAWADQTLPVPFSTVALQEGDRPVPVSVLNQDRSWVRAQVSGASDDRRFSFVVPVAVVGGASGGRWLTPMARSSGWFRRVGRADPTKAGPDMSARPRIRVALCPYGSSSSFARHKTT